MIKKKKKKKSARINQTIKTHIKFLKEEKYRTERDTLNTGISRYQPE